MSISTPGTVSRIACVSIAMILSVLTARAENDDRFAHGAAALKANATSGKSSRTRNVHCEMGRKLSHAIKWANPGDTLRISGTCMESVEIATDRLTLLGVSGAAIDGGKRPSEAVVLIDGARRVSLIGLDVRNGSDQGVLATRGAAPGGTAGAGAGDKRVCTRNTLRRLSSVNKLIAARPQAG